MRFAALLLLLGSMSHLPSADASEDGTDVPHTNIRKAMLSEYKFVAPKGPTQQTPFLTDTLTPPRTMPSMPQDSDLVKMAPFTVRENLKMDALHTDILVQKANAHAGAITGKLGIGVHVAPMGPVGFYAVTVFYIPIVVGFGFSF